MPEITVKDNIDKFSRKLDLVQKRQVPFATSRALNDTAIKVQEAEVKGIMLRFNNRKKWWIKGNRRTGVRVDFSSKKKLPLRSSVYTNAYFAELQEKGGTKSPVSGKVLAIPTDRTPKSMRRSDGIKRAKNNSAVFVSKKGVFRRMAKGKVKTLFTWARVAQVPARFKWETTAQVAAKRWFPVTFKKRLEEAIRTAKL